MVRINGRDWKSPGKTVNEMSKMTKQMEIITIGQKPFYKSDVL